MGGPERPHRVEAGMAEVAVTIEGLQRAITAAEPAAFLVAPRLLRRAIRALGARSFVGLSVPHPRCLAIGGAVALRVIEPEELGLDPNADPPDVLYLLARPDPDELAELPPGHGLIDAWRRLFHARVHAELERRLSTRGADLLGRIRRIGEVEFEGNPRRPPARGHDLAAGGRPGDLHRVRRRLPRAAPLPRRPPARLLPRPPRPRADRRPAGRGRGRRRPLPADPAGRRHGPVPIPSV